MKNGNQFRNRFIFPALSPPTKQKASLFEPKPFCFIVGKRSLKEEKYRARFLFVFHDCQFEQENFRCEERLAFN